MGYFCRKETYDLITAGGKTSGISARVEHRGQGGRTSLVDEKKTVEGDSPGTKLNMGKKKNERRGLREGT